MFLMSLPVSAFSIHSPLPGPHREYMYIFKIVFAKKLNEDKFCLFIFMRIISALQPAKCNYVAKSLLFKSAVPLVIVSHLLFMRFTQYLFCSATRTNILTTTRQQSLHLTNVEVFSYNKYCRY